MASVGRRRQEVALAGYEEIKGGRRRLGDVHGRLRLDKGGVALDGESFGARGWMVEGDY